MSRVGSIPSSTLPRGSALTVSVCRVQLAVIVVLQVGTFQVRVIGSPDWKRKFAAVTILYGSVYEPLALKLWTRPPLTPDALTKALFGFARLVRSTSWCAKV